MIILAILTVLPLLLVVSISFSSAESLARNGYKFIPETFTLEPYKLLMKTGAQIRDSYIITIFYTITGTVMSLTVMSMFAFVLAQRNFKFRTIYTFILFFTMLFSGGLVPSYIINVRYLGLKDTVWIFLLPSLISAYNVIILRTFIQTTIPDALFEAARIDGASHFTVFFRIVLPLFKPGLATIGLFNVVSRWNDWFTGMLYIDNPKLVPLQTLLQRILRSIQFIKENAQLEGTKRSSGASGQYAYRIYPNGNSGYCCYSYTVCISLLPALLHRRFDNWKYKGLSNTYANLVIKFSYAILA